MALSIYGNVHDNRIRSKIDLLELITPKSSESLDQNLVLKPMVTRGSPILRNLHFIFIRETLIYSQYLVHHVTFPLNPPVSSLPCLGWTTPERKMEVLMENKSVNEGSCIVMVHSLSI